MSTLEEAGITKGKQILATNVEEEVDNTLGGDSLSQERSNEESSERQETHSNTVSVVQRSGHGHSVLCHFRPDDQHIRRVFVNRSRPQSSRSCDVIKGSCFYHFLNESHLLFFHWDLWSNFWFYSLSAAVS